MAKERRGLVGAAKLPEGYSIFSFFFFFLIIVNSLFYYKASGELKKLTLEADIQ